jgi:hypothetical protein
MEVSLTINGKLYKGKVKIFVTKVVADQMTEMINAHIYSEPIFRTARHIANNIYPKPCKFIWNQVHVP